MKIEGSQLLRISRAWFAADFSSLRRAIAEREVSAGFLGSDAQPDSIRLLEISQTIAAQKLLRQSSLRALRIVEELFDEVASRNREPDQFGERLEVCCELVFLAWRHATQLGQEVDGLEWLRVSDVLVNEEFVAAESLSNFLYLPEDGKSSQLAGRFLGGAFEMFLALAILRRDRNRAPLQVFRAAANLYQSVSLAPEGELRRGELEFFRGEAVFLCATISRGLGNHTTCATWRRAAKFHFRKMVTGRLLRLKLLAMRLVELRDTHRTAAVIRRTGLVVELLETNGLYYEALGCRIGIAFVHKAMGELREARDALVELVARCKDTSFHGYSAICLGNLAEILFDEGRESDSKIALAQALIEAAASRDPLVLAGICGNVATIESRRGDKWKAVRAFREAIFHYASVGARRWVAYIRVFLSEILLDALELDDAARELRLAIPVLREEKLFPEVVHALRLLRLATRAVRETRTPV